MPGKRREHYRGSYTLQAEAVRRYAYANPATPCGICGRTLDQHPHTSTGKPPTWDAGHVLDGVPGSPLRPEVATCNRAAGAAIGNRRRAGVVNPGGW